MISKTIGNLKIISEIGKGGMGIVYLAEHIHLKTQFAAKCLAPELTRNPQFHERFFQEARSQAMLEHPNIVQVRDFFEQDGQFFLIMEYIDGQVLDEIIESKGKLPEKEALAIFKESLDALNFAHSKGVIHRDIKPSNILVSKNNRAYIMDFGIAILAGGKRLTATGMNVGTAWYMSPEHIRRPKTIDHRSDVYSMGIVLYEMLTGKPPFDGETDYEIKEKHCRFPPPPPIQKNSRISKIMNGIILKALKKNPDDRFDGCGEFLRYIKAYEAGGIKRKTVTDAPEKRLKKTDAGKMAAEKLPLKLKKAETQKIATEKFSPKKRSVQNWLVAVALTLAVVWGFDKFLTEEPYKTATEIHEKETGRLNINTYPRGAEVFINDEYKGYSPLKVSLRSGEYQVSLKKESYITKEENIHVESGGTENFSYRLEKMPATLWIISNPPGADVYIDGRKKGETPVTMKDIDIGRYDIKLALEGYETWQRIVQLSAGSQEVLRARLVSSAWTEPVTGMKFVRVPKGCFRMGTPEHNPTGGSDEGPVHNVCIEGFWMGQYEVSNAQYRKFRPEHDSGEHDGYSLNGARHPVVQVSWEDANAFILWLNSKNNGIYEFRLPTEAEWEYACVGKADAAMSRGDNPDDDADRDENHHWLSQILYYYDATAIAGSYRYNAFNLRDMLGNTWEWCEDMYSSDAYSRHRKNNPVYAGDGSSRVVRGCSSTRSKSGNLRCADRGAGLPDFRSSYLGFRLVRK